MTAPPVSEYPMESLVSYLPAEGGGQTGGKMP